MTHDIFISHSQKDKIAADAACNVFERNGLRCWIAPRDVDGSRPWAEAIVDAIDSSKILVLVFSGSSNASEQVTREIDCAISKNVVIVPVRIEDVLPSHAMKYYLATSHWVDAFPPYEENFDRITNRLNNLLGRAVTEAKRPPRQSRPKGALFIAGGASVVAVVVVIGSLYMFSAPRPVPPSPDPHSATACDKPADFPESDKSRLSGFIYFDRDNRDQLREWSRIKGDLWIEASYENAQSTKVLTTKAYFDVKGRSHVAFCDGSIVAREDDPALQLWIPDRDCENKSLRFRRVGCGWIALPVIREAR